jgi:hypothetical protein
MTGAELADTTPETVCYYEGSFDPPTPPELDMTYTRELAEIGQDGTLTVDIVGNDSTLFVRRPAADAAPIITTTTASPSS